MTTNRTRRSVMTSAAVVFSLALLGGGVGGMGGCSSMDLIPTAPHVSIQNHSDARVTVQHWTGRLDYREPNGVADWRMPVERTVTAGECVRCALGSMHSPTQNTDLVIRLRMDYIDPVTFDPHTEWMELAHPAPYRIVIDQDEEGISIRSATTGSLAVVPEAERIPGHLDDLPIWDARGAQLPPISN